MVSRLLRAALAAALAVVAPACVFEAPDPEGPPSTEEDEVKVDTSTPEARAQYDANVAFARAYTPRCALPDDGAPRVLVTGYGRFHSITTNATGKIVSALVPSARYPETRPAPAGQVEPPEEQLSVGVATLDLEGVGRVHVCGMILPVYWDLAAVLAAKEIAAIRPQMVIMNGVASSAQPLWLELGAVNKAVGDDSSGLSPVADRSGYAKIISNAPPSEESRGNLLAWERVRRAVDEARARHSAEVEGGASFGSILQEGALYARFPRTNTYLCNNITYVTGYLMDHGDRTVRLLQASARVSGKPNDVRVTLGADLSRVPRVFFHWPSGLATRHHAAGADVLRAAIAAQLTAGAASTRGDAITPSPGSP